GARGEHQRGPESCPTAEQAIAEQERAERGADRGDRGRKLSRPFGHSAPEPRKRRDGPGEERGLVAVLLAFHGGAEPRSALQHVAGEQDEACFVRFHDQVVTARRKDEERSENHDERRAVATAALDKGRSGYRPRSSRYRRRERRLVRCLRCRV